MVKKKKSEYKIKQFKITYMIPGVAAEMSMISDDNNKDDVEKRFMRLFKDNKIIKIEEIK